MPCTDRDRSAVIRETIIIYPTYFYTNVTRYNSVFLALALHTKCYSSKHKRHTYPGVYTKSATLLKLINEGCELYLYLSLSPPPTTPLAR